MMTEEERIARYLRHKDDGGWIGVDLDGTFAEYHEWGAALSFGPPIPKMVERVKGWIELGMEVRVVTARMPIVHDVVSRLCEVTGTRWNYWDMFHAIGDWTEECVGKRLASQCYKDLNMLELWDDRAVQVVPNTGMTLAEYLTQDRTSEQTAEAAALAGKP